MHNYSKHKLENGLCRKGCGRPLAKRSKSRCEVCLEKDTKRSREQQESNNTNGLCRQSCGRPIASHSITYCNECLLTIKKQRDERLERMSVQERKKEWARRTIRSHEQNGFEVKITIEELTQKALSISTCPLCDIELIWIGKGSSSQRESASLDRKENEKVITKENAEIMCHACNTHKGNFTSQQLLEWAKRVISFYTVCG